LGQFGLPYGMALYQTPRGSDRVAMQAMELLPWFLCLGQAPPVFLVVLLGCSLQLLLQFLFALGIKENLILSEIAQGSRRFVATDATLMAA
jgi:hypothetical protein